MNPLVQSSFNEAIQKTSEILDNNQNSNLWFGRKVFLGYNNKTGWKVYELGFFDQILRTLTWKVDKLGFCKRMCRRLNYYQDYQDTHLAHVLRHLPEKEKIPTDNVDSNSNDLINKLLQLKESRKILKKREKEKLKKEKKEKSNLTSLSSVKIQKEQVLIQPLVTSPLYLENYEASRCYLDSVLEIMLSQDVIREKIYQTYAKNDMSKEKKKIVKALINLIEVVDRTQGKGEDNESPQGKNSPAERIRKVIFRSQINSDLSGKENRYEQQDAASALLLINELLDNTFETLTVDTPLGRKDMATEGGEMEKQCKLEVHIEKGQENTLQDLVEKLFIPQEAEKKKNFLFEGKQTGPLSYTAQTMIASFPDSLALHVLRQDFNTETNLAAKLSEHVTLPPDGIIQFISANGEKHLYEITGYVIHEGKKLQSGHYTSCVKIDDKYYACNNMSQQLFQEISSESFYANQDAYLVMLKKLKND